MCIECLKEECRRCVWTVCLSVQEVRRKCLLTVEEVRTNESKEGQGCGHGTCYQ